MYCQSPLYSWQSPQRIASSGLLYERRIEFSLFKTMAELGRRQLIRQLQKEDVCEAEPAQAIPSLRDEAATRHQPAEKKDDLKKQSQFAQALIGAKSFMQGDYNNNPACRAEENKSNQSQINAFAFTKRVGKEAKSDAAANSLTG